MTAHDFGGLAQTPAAMALTFAIAVVYPLIGWYRFRRIEARPEPLPKGVKFRLYASVVVSQWTLVALVALLLATRGQDLAALGQGPGVSILRTALVALALLVGFAVLSRYSLAQLAVAAASDLPTHVRKAGRILPRDRLEQAGYVPVAITAGVCEEILYRGWLPWALAAWTGSPAAGLVGAALVFGAGHAYQGRNGVILTTLLALFLGGIVAWTGSLLPGQFLHVAVDLVNGLAVGATLARHAAAARARAPAPEPEPGEEPARVDLDGDASLESGS